VLDLLPGEGDDDIQCALRTVNLDDDEEWEALSYVWGEPTAEKNITISGLLCPVTPNLYAALRRLRLTTKCSVWIDQLCINQQDNDERATQVAMMREIYRTCSRCLIWFGELDHLSYDYSEQDAEAVFDFFTVVAAAKGPPSDGDLPILFHDTDAGRRARTAFEAFSMYGNPWWSRIWTIQEAIIPESAVFVWGRLRLDRDVVFRAALRLRGSVMTRIFSTQFRKQRVLYIPLLRRVLYPIRGFLHYKNGEKPLDLMMRWRHRDSRDPRDKVYALLGLMPAHVLPCALRCSYEISASTLFQGATMDLMRRERGLRPFLGSAEIRHVTPDLSTWAIDFACSNRVGERQLKWWNHAHRYQEFSAAGRLPLELSILEDGKVLGLIGLLIDDVAHIYAFPSLQDNEIVNNLSILGAMEGARDLLHHFKSTPTASPTYINGQKWESAFWRTLVGDVVMHEFPRQRVNDSHEQSFQSLLKVLASDRQDPVNNLDASASSIASSISTSEVDAPSRPRASQNLLYESVCGMVLNNAFFITKSGYLGIGPPGTQLGDQVWIFHGGKVPFVMRSATEYGDSYGHDKLLLVGDAYVHGIMDGEAARQEHETRRAWIY
jgi:hypothetical protein